MVYGMHMICDVDGHNPTRTRTIQHLSHALPVKLIEQPVQLSARAISISQQPTDKI